MNNYHLILKRERLKISFSFLRKEASYRGIDIVGGDCVEDILLYFSLYHGQFDLIYKALERKRT